MDIETFVRRLPKAELHLHIEGALEPELLFALAERNGVGLAHPDVASLRKAYSFDALQDFLDIYYQGAAVLRTAEDFYDLASAYCARAAADGVRHAEVFFDPQTHTDRGVPMAVVIDGLAAAFDEAERRHGLTSRLILCFLRHLSEAAAFETLADARPWLGRITGVGLDSSERGQPPAKFARVFAEAGRLGLKRVAHAGEEGPAAYVAEALDALAVDRLDHGNRALEDPALCARIARRGLALTVCPLSNYRLKVEAEDRPHPVARMLRLGLRATVNSDDPAYFGGYVADNYLAVADAVGPAGLVTLARNSFLGSFLDDDAIAARLSELDAFAEAEAGGLAVR